jgi:hypothetical protein
VAVSEFLSTAAFKKRERPFYVDYGRQLETALTLAKIACSTNTVQFMTAFGFAGTGKSSLGRPLWWHLNAARHPVSLLTINCLALHSKDPAEAISDLRDIMNWCLADVENYPLLVILDEIEAIAPKRRSPLTLWTMQLLKSLRSQTHAAIVVGCSNYPDALDITIDSEMGPCIYFPEATDDLLIQIARVNGIRAAGEFAECYRQKCGTRYVPLPRPYVEGIRHLTGLGAHVRVAWRRSSTVDQRVAVAQSMSPPALREHYLEYEKQLAPWIDRANSLRSVLLA